MSQFADKHKRDLNLIFGTYAKDVKVRFPNQGDDFTRRIIENLQRPLEAVIDKIDAAQSSTRLSPDGKRADIRAAARAVHENVVTMRSETFTRLDREIAEQLAAALKPRTQTTDPLEALKHEMRMREMRDHLYSLDSLRLQQRIRQTTNDAPSMELLEALEGAPAGFPIAQAEWVQAARLRIAEEAHPEIDQLRQLRGAYSYAIGVAEQTLLTASGFRVQELYAEPARQDPRQPYRVSNGQTI